MNEKIAQYRERIAQYWRNFSKMQKMMIGATFGVLILSIVILSLIFSKTDYELAFKDLDAADAAAIVEYLEGNNIIYQLGADGSSISVPSAVASKVKVDVGSQGLVQNGSIGFDSFNEGSSQFGMTDNEFGVKYRNALNGEIQQLLNGMQGVQKTNVLINLPQESVFLNPEDEEKASASIMMTFKSGYRPKQEEIDGYFNLVKTAVPKLAVEDITISGPQGEMMASNKVEGGSGISAQSLDSQFQVQRKYESDLKRNIQQFLGPMVGMENLVISIASNLNFDKKNSKEQLVSPLPDNNNNGIVESEQTQNKTSTGEGSSAGGVVGTGETDVPGYQATDGAGSTSSEESAVTRNYDFNRITNEIISDSFTVKDLSVSIGVQEGSLNEDRREAVLAYLTALVRAQLAESGQDISDDTLLGKKVSLISQPFAANGSVTESSGIPLAWGIGIGAAALALAGVAGYVLMRRRKQAELEAEQEELIQPAKVELPTIDLENVTNDSQVRKQLEQLAKRKPEDFVNLLRTWLVDE